MIALAINFPKKRNLDRILAKAAALMLREQGSGKRPVGLCTYSATVFEAAAEWRLLDEGCCGWGVGTDSSSTEAEDAAKPAVEMAEEAKTASPRHNSRSKRWSSRETKA